TPEKILNFIPANIFLDMTGERPTSVIAVVIFSMIVGIAVLGLRRKNPEQAETFTKIIHSLYAVVMRIVTLILRLTPFGVLTLMANTVAKTDVVVIMELGKLVVASYVALFVMFIIHLILVGFFCFHPLMYLCRVMMFVMFIIHLILVGLFGLHPLKYLRKVMPVLGFAFTSRSSAGTIPLNIQAQKNSLGVDEGIANMSASFGATIGQNGCAGIYPAMLAVMIAPTVGIDPLTWEFIVPLTLIIGMSSFGVAGVGGGATFAA